MTVKHKKVPKSKARPWWGIRRIIDAKTGERLAQQGDTLVVKPWDAFKIPYLQINHPDGKKTLVRRFAKPNRLKRVGLL